MRLPDRSPAHAGSFPLPAAVLLSAWLAGIAAFLCYQGYDTVRAAAHSWGRTEEGLRGERHGDRWPFYQAVAALPAESVITLENGGDDLYYQLAYYAYPRVIVRAADVTGVGDAVGPPVEGRRPEDGSGRPLHFRARFHEEDGSFAISPAEERHN